MKSSSIARRMLNVVIRQVNRRLTSSEWIPAIPIIPFIVENHLEVVVLQYYNLIMDGYADWRNDGSVRKDEIIALKKALVQKHGTELKRYLAPYIQKHSSRETTASREEHHRCRVAYDLYNR